MIETGLGALNMRNDGYQFEGAQSVRSTMKLIWRTLTIWLVALAVLIFCVFFCMNTQADIEVMDDAGRTVIVQQPVKRIISLSPHTTELLYSAGAGNLVVAVSAYSDYPAAAKTLPKISGGTGVDIERIVAFMPDLVVAWQSGNSRSQLQQLESWGLTVFYSEPATIDAIATNVESLGRLAGTQEYANKTASEFRAQVDQLTLQYRYATKLNGFYQIWSSPLMTIGGDHLISQWLSLCGVENIFADQASLAPVVSIESVLSRDPDVLISGQFGLSFEAFRDSWSQWRHLSAVVSNNLILQNATVLSRQVPRAVKSAAQLCQAVEKLGL